MMSITSTLSHLNQAIEKKDGVRKRVAEIHKSLDDAESVVAFETELLFAQVLPLMQVGEVLFDPYTHGGDKPIFGVMKLGDGKGKIIPLVTVYTAESRAEVEGGDDTQVESAAELQTADAL